MAASRSGNYSYLYTHSVELCALFIGVLTLFIGVSLYSYHPNDSSWFVYRTDGPVIHNWCGIAGAYSAALLVYLFGFSAWLFVFFLLFVNYLVINRIAWRDEWERIGGWFAVISATAALFHLYAVNGGCATVPGGAIGSYFAYYLICVFDYFGAALFLYTLLFVSVILITRFSFITGTQIIYSAICTVIECTIEISCYSTCCEWLLLLDMGKCTTSSLGCAILQSVD